MSRLQDEADGELHDLAGMFVDILRVAARRWRFRAQAGRLGSHSMAATGAFVDSLERAALLIEAGANAASTIETSPSTSLALDNSEERFRLLVDGVRDYAIFMLDPEGHVLSWNAGAERIYGYAAEEILGQHFSRLYPPEEVAGVMPELHTAATVGRFQGEGLRLRKDGTRFWASIVLSALRDPQGRLRGYSKVIRDVTDRRQAYEALRQSEERFRLIVEAVQDYAIFMLDPQGVIVSWNTGAERIKGYSATEIIGKHFSTFYTDADRARDHPANELAIARSEGRFEEEGWRIRKDGSRFWASVTITALRAAGGELIGFAKVTRDMTQRKLYEDALRQTIRARDEFLAVASHELKTPMAAMQLQLEGLADDIASARLADAPSIGSRIDGARRSGDRLAALIEALLDVSRLATKRLRLAHEDFDLSALIADVAASARHDAERAGSELRIVTDGPALAGGDRRRLEQVLHILLSNAVKFGAGKPIDLRLALRPEAIVISVRDRGPGIPEEHRARVFEPFERAVDTQHYGGLGVGLYLARRLVEAHGGTIELASPKDGGTELIVRLPRDAETSTVTAIGGEPT